MGISIYGLGNEKHKGLVDFELAKRGANVVYLNSSGVDFAQRGVKGALEIPIPMDYYCYLDSINYIFATATTQSKGENHTFFVHPHSFAAFLESLMECVPTYKLYSNIDYWLDTSLKLASVFRAFNKRHNRNKPKVLNSGYAAFDIEPEPRAEIKKDSLLITMHDPCEFLDILGAIKALLNKGVRIIIRARLGWREEFLKEELQDLQKSPNCHIFVSNDGFNEAIERSFATITTYSSLAYTFPIKTLCPAILFFKDKERFNREIEGFYFYEERLHFKASNDDELIKIVEDLQRKLENGEFSEINKRILEYREEDVFCYKKASANMAEQILEIIKELECS